MKSQVKSLASQSCTPCRGGIPALNADQVKVYHRQTPQWAVRDEARRIERTFKFKNFAEALVFSQRVGDLAKAEGHHPDISFGWGYATVSLQTKKVKGLHENDFILAAKLDELTKPKRATRRSSARSRLESITAQIVKNEQITPTMD